jgi:hypothetical protein
MEWAVFASDSSGLFAYLEGLASRVEHMSFVTRVSRCDIAAVLTLDF